VQPGVDTLRYGHHTSTSTRASENFLLEGSKWGLGKRDLVSKHQLVHERACRPPDGSLGIVDGISAPGLRVTARAHRDTLVIISNCPQINNPCNGFDPTPIRVVVAS